LVGSALSSFASSRRAKRGGDQRDRALDIQELENERRERIRAAAAKLAQTNREISQKRSAEADVRAEESQGFARNRERRSQEKFDADANRAALSPGVDARSPGPTPQTSVPLPRDFILVGDSEIDGAFFDRTFQQAMSYPDSPYAQKVEQMSAEEFDQEIKDRTADELDARVAAEFSVVGQLLGQMTRGKVLEKGEDEEFGVRLNEAFTSKDLVGMKSLSDDLIARNGEHLAEVRTEDVRADEKRVGKAVIEKSTLQGEARDKVLQNYASLSDVRKTEPELVKIGATIRLDTDFPMQDLVAGMVKQAVEAATEMMRAAGVSVREPGQGAGGIPRAKKAAVKRGLRKIAEEVPPEGVEEAERALFEKHGLEYTPEGMRAVLQEG
jgi:hypothetical protein